MTGWDQESIDKLVGMHREGMSSGIMAIRLSKSRSAIAGMVFRLRQKGVLKDEARVPKRSFGEKGGYASTPRMRKARGSNDAERTSTRRKRQFMVDGKPLTATPVPLPRSEDIARVTFADLEHHHCRFVCCAESAQAVADGEKLFCGLQQVPGSSYCEGHLARVSPEARVLTPARQAWINGEGLGARFAPESPEEMPA